MPTIHITTNIDALKGDEGKQLCKEMRQIVINVLNKPAGVATIVLTHADHLTIGNGLEEGCLIQIHSIGLHLKLPLQAMVKVFASHGITEDKLVFIFTDKEAHEYSMNGKTIFDIKNPPIDWDARKLVANAMCLAWFAYLIGFPSIKGLSLKK